MNLFCIIYLRKLRVDSCLHSGKENVLGTHPEQPERLHSEHDEGNDGSFLLFPFQILLTDD
jgi:hypothetical protein